MTTTTEPRLGMDEKSDLASELTAYIVKYHTQIPLSELEVKQANGDILYSDRVQDIFNNVLDIVDNALDPEEEE